MADPIPTAQPARPPAWRAAPLVGRRRELYTLLTAVTDAPSTVIIEGEAGVGKTRLIEELLAHPDVASHRRLVGHARPMREPFPLGAVLEALRALEGTLGEIVLNPVAGALHPLLPELSSELPPPLAGLGEHLAERHRIFRGIVEVLTALGPTILVLEDLHWADDVTTELLRFVIDRLPPTLVLVVSVRREQAELETLQTGSARVSTVPLAPFSVGEVRAFMSGLLNAAPAPDVVELVHRQTAGLPFAVEEVVKLLHDESSGSPDDSSFGNVRLPAGVRNSVLQRRAELDPTAQTLLDAAAVLGRPASESLLQAVAATDADATAAALISALQAGMLTDVGSGRFGFRHALAQDAVYENIVAPARRSLHAAAFDALSGDPAAAVEELAQHSAKAGLVPQWRTYAEATADAAIALGNDSAAVEILLELASDETWDGEARGRIVAKLCESAWRAHQSAPAVVPAVRAFLAGTTDPATRGRLRFLLGRLLLQEGDLSGGREQFIQSLPDLEGEPGVAARAMASIAMAGHLASRAARDLHWAETAAEAAAAQDDDFVKLVVLVDHLTVLAGLGDPRVWDLAEQIPAVPRNPEERVQIIRAHANVAAWAATVGHTSRAEEHLAMARQLAAGHYGGSGMAFIDCTDALLAWQTGRWDECARIVGRYLEERHPQFSGAIPEFRCMDTVLRFVRGSARHREVVDLFAQSLAACQHEATGWMAGIAIRHRLSLGAVDEACRLTGQAWGLLRSDDSGLSATEFLVPGTDALSRAGRIDDAQEMISSISAATATRDVPGCTAVIRTAAARLDAARNRPAEAIEGFEEAERMWVAVNHPYTATQALEHRADVLKASDPQEGERLLHKALASYLDIGAAWDAARVRRTLREHGLHQPRQRGRNAYGLSLTPRERQVVMLAAEGATDRAIAERLVLSTRTVEGHLGRALAKLRLSSRRELAAVIEREGAARLEHP